MSINSLSSVRPPVVNFYWTPKSTALTFAEFGTDGDTFTMQRDDVPRNSDYRYEVLATQTNQVLTFVYDPRGDEGEGAGAYVPDPFAVPIVEYFWWLGDGTTAYGPEVTWLYLADIKSLTVTLRVTDTRGKTATRTRYLQLRPASVGAPGDYLAQPGAPA